MLNNGAPPPRRDHAGSNSNYNKPVPPPPSQAQSLRPQQDSYGRQSTPSGGYRDPQPPGAYGSSNPAPPPPNQGYNDGRGNGPRYDQYNQQSQSPRYGSGGQQGGYGGPPPQQHQQQQGYGQAPPPRSSSTAYGVASPPPAANYGQGPPRRAITTDHRFQNINGPLRSPHHETAMIEMLYGLYFCRWIKTGMDSCRRLSFHEHW